MGPAHTAVLSPPHPIHRHPHHTGLCQYAAVTHSAIPGGLMRVMVGGRGGPEPTTSLCLPRPVPGGCTPLTCARPAEPSQLLAALAVLPDTCSAGDTGADRSGYSLRSRPRPARCGAGGTARATWAQLCQPATRQSAWCCQVRRCIWTAQYHGGTRAQLASTGCPLTSCCTLSPGACPHGEHMGSRRGGPLPELSRAAVSPREIGAQWHVPPQMGQRQGHGPWCWGRTSRRSAWLSTCRRLFLART